MALRVRKDGRILCAAKSKPEEGDIYINDDIHCWLTRCLDISINVIDSMGEDENGEEEWKVIEREIWIMKKQRYVAGH
jgi:hypothetical protein